MRFQKTPTALQGASLKVWIPPTVACGLFLLLAVSAHTGGPFPGDVPVAQAVQSSVPESAQPLLLLVHALGGRLAEGVYGMAAVAALFALRHRVESFLVLLALLIAPSNAVIKELVGRPRPDPALVHVHVAAGGVYGFPSGDTQFFTVFFGLLFVFAPMLVSSPRLLLLIRGLCGLLVLLVGPARVALGVHWPSDVLGGYLLGGLILWGLLALHSRFASQGVTGSTTPVAD